MEELTKKFNMTIADLAMFASNLVSKMQRDATYFAARGVDAAAITAFESLGNAYEVFPPDVDFLGQYMEAINEKNALRETVTRNIQYISGFVEQKWGIDSPRYKRLGISKLQNLSDNDFLKISRNVVDKANDWLLELTAEGLTQSDIDTLESNAQLWEDKANEADDFKDLRESKTHERTMMGNELYSYVTKYCTIGKLIWENENSSYYDDYLMYPKVSHSVPKVVGMAYDLGTGQCSWSAVPNGEEYELQFAIDQPGPIYTTVYQGPDLGFVYDPGGPDYYLFRCRCRIGSSWGEWSDVLVVIRP